MKILLINPPNNMNKILGKANVFVSDFEPMGLLYIASMLEKYGHEVKILDAFLERLTLADIKREVIAYSPDIVGITCLTSTGHLTYEIGKMLKKCFPKILVVLGNKHASVFAEALIENRIGDIVVHGEGEYAMVDIAKTFKLKKDFSSIKGISWWNGKKVINNPLREPVRNLDDLPLPARHLIANEKYAVRNLSNFIYINKTEKTTRQMFTSRGCVFQCKFCVVHQKGNYRTHSPIRTVDEMELLIKKYNAGYIFIMDSLFIANKKRVIEICKEIKKRKLKFFWGCEGHVKLVDRELLLWMKKAGCYEMHFGIESGVQRLLDNVNKGTTIEQIEKAVALTKKIGIKVSGLFMLGLPGETFKDSIETINFACCLPLDFAQFSITVPYPGSQLFDELSSNGLIETGVRNNGSIDSHVWERFSAYSSFTKEKPIYLPDGMSIDELKKVQKIALRKFYLRPTQIIKQIKRLNLINLKEFMTTFKFVFLNYE